VAPSSNTEWHGQRDVGADRRSPAERRWRRQARERRDHGVWPDSHVGSDDRRRGGTIRDSGQPVALVDTSSCATAATSQLTRSLTHRRLVGIRQARSPDGCGVPSDDGQHVGAGGCFALGVVGRAPPPARPPEHRRRTRTSRCDSRCAGRLTVASTRPWSPPPAPPLPSAAAHHPRRSRFGSGKKQQSSR